MKRLLLMMAAVASVIAVTPAAVAYARDDGQGRRAESQGRGRGPAADRGGGRRYDGDRGGGRQYERGRPGGERRVEEVRPRPRDEDDRRARVPALGYGDERRGRRRDEDGPPRNDARPRDDDRPRYGYEGGGRRPPQGFAPPPSARRGGYLPRSFSGEIIDDYRRYRLRTPPAGFAWVRMGNGFALVSMRDGQIFDMVQ